MNNRPHKSLGRGQALQRVMVMAQSINSLNVTEMRMENYTNEKIMEFLETMTQRTNGGGPPMPNLEPRNEQYVDSEDEGDVISSLPQDPQPKEALHFVPKEDERFVPNKAVQSIPNEDWNNSKASFPSPPDVLPGQFSFNEDDFPSLCEKS